MRGIRFDRPGKAPETVTKKAVPDHMKEPLLKRILQGVVVIAVVSFGSYWLISVLAFHQYSGIVVGDQATLTLMEPGIVKEYYVDAHQRFLTGSPLMKIESPTLSIRRQALEREIDLLQSRLLASEAEEHDLLGSKLVAAKAAVQSAEAEKTAANEKEALAQDLWERTQKLRAEGAVTQLTVDARVRELRAAQASSAAAGQKVLEAREALHVSVSALERADQLGTRQKFSDEGELREKIALLNELKGREERLTLKGDRSGFVTHLNKLPGDVIQPGEPVMQVLYEAEDSLWIDVYVDPEDGAVMRPGRSVTIKTGGFLKAKDLRGVVTSISPVTHRIPDSHRDAHDRLDQFIVARVTVDAKEAFDLGFSPGQLVKVQAPRW